MSYDKPSLFVAPDVDLPYDDKEAENVVNRLGSNLLKGEVRIADLEARVRSIQPKLIIISSHGGRIEVKSEIGRGTRFEIVLPVSPATSTKASDNDQHER